MSLWFDWRQLNNTPALMVGEVTAHEAGDSVVMVHGGAEFKARGTAVAVGKKCYVKDGTVQGEAPDLPVVATQYI